MYLTWASADVHHHPMEMPAAPPDAAVERQAVPVRPRR